MKANSSTEALKPVVTDLKKALDGLHGITSFKWLFFVNRKPQRMTSWMTVPPAVAMAAPAIPMPMGNTKNQSPKILKTPPATTAPMTTFGAPSQRTMQVK